MKRYIILIALILLTACAGATHTEFNASDCKADLYADGSGSIYCKKIVTLTPASSASATLTPTPPNPSPTAVPSATKTPTVVPSLTAVPTQITGTNLFKDGGLEGPYISKLHSDGFYHIVPRDWTAFYCDGCPAYRQGTGNPTGLKLGRPEYKPAAVDQDALRIHSGTNAVEYFGFYRAIEGGIYQTITTVPGSSCTATGYVQAWSGADGDLDPHKSHLFTTDDKANATFYILVDTAGGTNAFAGGVLKSRAFGYDDGVYDRWAKVSYDFVATSTKTTIFYDNIRLWPFRNNNNYLDDLSVVCSGGSVPSSTPIPTSTPTSVVTPTPASGSFPAFYNADEYYKYTRVTNIRTSRDYNIATNLTGLTYTVGDIVKFFCIAEEKSGEYWGSTSSCSSSTTWSVIQIGTEKFADKYLPGGEG